MHRYASPSTSPSYYAGSSSSHPSPAPSNASGTSSATSSLRTPPDLLVNGASVGHTGKSQLRGGVVNSWNGLLVKPRPPRCLSSDEIVRRRALLDGLHAEPEAGGWSLPSPPRSPELEPLRKRIRSDDVSTQSMLASEPPPPPPPPAAAAAVASRPRALTPSSSSLAHLASAYRRLARALKHSADTRPCTHPSYLSRPHPLSALEQLDAVLLFCHAFYLDDLAASTTLVKNWTSLFGLLRYATNAHSDLGNDVLLGVCRCIEAAVLRKLANHDSKLLLRALDAGQLADLAQLLQRHTSDLERADRLWSQARNLLAIPNLQHTHPDLLQMALTATLPCTEAAAKHVDPGQSEEACTFAWPIDSGSPMPFLVAFGRRALVESARRTREAFVLRSVAEVA